MSVATLAVPASLARSGGRAPVSRNDHQRAVGTAEIGFVHRHGVTRIARLHQSGSIAVRLPHVEPDDVPQAIAVTTCGGLTGGDRIELQLVCEANAGALVTTQAAEKIYRSAGGEAVIEVGIEVGAGGALEWLPQETILFDGSRMRRTTEAALADDGRLLGIELVVFGRIARGERLRTGFVSDAWRVRRGGRLVWADVLRIDGSCAAMEGNPACLDGGGAVMTVLFVAPEASGADEGTDTTSA
jgi:urease accessory protein